MRRSGKTPIKTRFLYLKTYVMIKTFVSQDYDRYTSTDHETWAILSERQGKLRDGRIAREYTDGFEQLQLDKDRVVNIEEMSKRLEAISGWTLIPVTGLIPTRDFFYMLINKKYPVTIYMRKPHEIDFSEQPDIFHDVFGHLPLLTNEKFVKFLTAYSIIALKYINNDRAIEYLGRLYWYTYEMGLLREEGSFKPYGGAVITSAGEIENLNNPDVPKYNFDLDRVFQTPYNPYRLQKEYFVINSFDDLFDCIKDIENKLIEHLLLPDKDYTLRNFALNKNLVRGFNNVIGFLNDAQYKFPQAISFVAGQPDEQYFDLEDQVASIDTYLQHLAANTGMDRTTLSNRLGQYGKTKGIVNEIVAEYLRKDENISMPADNILLTVGAQEAFAVIVSTVCQREKDVILVEDPSYVGVSSFAKVFDYPIEAVPTDEEGIDLRALKDKLIEVSREGKRVKLLYVIPDYQNPSGFCMPIGSRLKLLELARKYNFLIIEDSVYNSFTYSEKKSPTLKSLDRYNSVIYVGSFSKLLFPGLRIGLIACDQQVENEMGETVWLIDEMAKVKAMLTNNTSAISQAILAGVLLENQCSLSELNKKKFTRYKLKRDTILGALERYVGQYADDWAGGIGWNEPDGGFFIKLSVPFTVTREDVLVCAAEYNIIFCPMRYFYLNGGGEKEIRLTFSNLSIEQIDAGIQRLAGYLQSRVAADGQLAEPAVLLQNSTY